MANTDRPTGFSFAKSLTGHAPNAMARKYDVTVNTTRTALLDGTIYLGDAVSLVRAGGVAGGQGTVVPFTSGEPCLGIVVGTGNPAAVEMGDSGAFNADDLSQRFIPETEAGTAWIIPVEGNLFSVQSATALTNPFRGGEFEVNPDATDASHGDTITSRSIMEIIDPTGATVNNDVRIVEINTGVENIPADAFAEFIVMFTRAQNTFIQDPAIVVV